MRLCLYKCRNAHQSGLTWKQSPRYLVDLRHSSPLPSYISVWVSYTCWSYCYCWNPRCKKWMPCFIQRKRLDIYQVDLLLLQGFEAHEFSYMFSLRIFILLYGCANWRFHPILLRDRCWRSVLFSRWNGSVGHTQPLAQWHWLHGAEIPRKGNSSRHFGRDVFQEKK